jgi:amino acid transporter
MAGGSYNFLNIAYGPKWGRLASFLFVWQTSIQAPLVAASGAIGFAQYFNYLIPLSFWQEKILAMLVIILVTLLLYRKIESIGKISVLLWAAVLLTMGWIIVSGLTHNPTRYTPIPREGGEFFKAAFWLAIGNASVRTIYSYLGYYNVCHLGGQIKQPGKNIPRSIFISIIGISILYLCMNLSLVHIVPWQDAQHSKSLISDFIEKLYGNAAARVATGMVLCVAFSSLFAVLLGYQRVPYAAAADGNFFPYFGVLHPTKEFPHRSLLLISGLAILFSLTMSIRVVIPAILAMRILVQFIAQTIGVVLLRRRKGSVGLPFKMWAYPLPVVLSLACWIFVFWHTGVIAIWGVALTVAGAGAYFLTRRLGWKPQEEINK